LTGVEQWHSLKGVVECGNNYEVSSFGNVRSILTGKIRKSNNDKDGYPYVELFYGGKRKTYKIHRLVALAFIPMQKDKTQVNHIDGRKDNNNVSNLEWVNSSENQLHAIRLGLVNKEKVSKHARELGSKYGAINGKKSAKQVGKYDLTGKLIKIYPSVFAASKENSVPISTVSMQCNRHAMSRYRNFYFRFICEKVQPSSGAV